MKGNSERKRNIRGMFPDEITSVSRRLVADGTADNVGHGIRVLARHGLGIAENGGSVDANQIAQELRAMSPGSAKTIVVTQQMYDQLDAFRRTGRIEVDGMSGALKCLAWIGSKSL
jgi:hypothetical protein